MQVECRRTQLAQMFSFEDHPGAHVGEQRSRNSLGRRQCLTSSITEVLILGTQDIPSTPPPILLPRLYTQEEDKGISWPSAISSFPWISGWLLPTQQNQWECDNPPLPTLPLRNSSTHTYQASERLWQHHMTPMGLQVSEHRVRRGFIGQLL